jgi:hypothetical protein
MTDNTRIPDKTTLRRYYDEAINQLNGPRGGILTREFYRKIGDAVFESGYLALSDAIDNTRRVHTIPAPAGSGKSTFAYAFIAAMTRFAQTNQNAPYGAVFLVEEKTKADEVYLELKALIGDAVGVWTEDHDVKAKPGPRTKVENPAMRCSRDDLRHYPVVICTHSGYLKGRGAKARIVERNGVQTPRMLTVVDERAAEVPTIDVILSDAQRVREDLVKTNPQLKEHLDPLFKFMEAFSYEKPNSLYRPGLEISATEIAKSLSWFQTKDARGLARTSKGAEVLFAFANALAAGRACVATVGVEQRFFGYQSQHIIDLTAGVLLLDASGNVDGINNIVPWRVNANVPQASYANLQIVHIPQLTTARLGTWFKEASNQRAYVDWICATIREHVPVGAKALVICHKDLFLAERVPNWNQGDPRFKQKHIFTKEWGWELDGRHLCCSWYGSGIGFNTWREASVVLLFGEFHQPRQVYVGTTQGYRNQKADEGDLAAMKSLTSKAKGVDAIAEGNLLRWLLQLGLRGSARLYDDKGRCSAQKLVVSCNLQRLLKHSPQLFPGAKITVTGKSNGNTQTVKVLEVLGKSQASVLSTKEINTLIGKPWRQIAHHVLKPEFYATITAMGWRYVSGRGKLGSRFERLTIAEPELQPIAA